MSEELSDRHSDDQLASPAIVPAGDSTLLVQFEERIDPAVNARAISVAAAIRAAAITGVRDIVPAYRSVAIYFDPLRTRYEDLVGRVRREVEAPAEQPRDAGAPIDVPVCYGGELGPDLEDVAAFAKMPVDQVVAIHSGMIYRVFMLGFMPGFAYMGTVDARIGAPRRHNPRLRVARGSVGLAGLQTGVYPSDSPGGWQLIGRTPLVLFDAGRAAPALFAAGDAVRFVPVGRAEFDRLRELPRNVEPARQQVRRS